MTAAGGLEASGTLFAVRTGNGPMITDERTVGDVTGSASDSVDALSMVVLASAMLEVAMRSRSGGVFAKTFA